MAVKLQRQGEDYEEEEEALNGEDEFEDDEDDTDEEADDEDEDDEDDEDEDDDEDDDDDEDSEIKTIFGIDRKYIVIGAVALFVIIVGTTIFRSGSKSKEVAEATSEPITDAVEYVPEDTPVTTESTPATSTTSTSTEATPGTVNDVVISDEMAKELQQYGYTGDEIELAKQFNIDPSALIESAKLRQINSVKEVVKQLSDSGSIAYQNLARMTYLGQEYVSAPVDQTKVDPEKAKVAETEETINCTYEKCPTYGVQLYLKCKVLDNVYVWYAVKPQRWVQLPETGSITLHVKYTRYGDNIYVSEMSEVTDPNARVVQSDTAEQTAPFAEQQDDGGIVQDDIN